MSRWNVYLRDALNMTVSNHFDDPVLTSCGSPPAETYLPHPPGPAEVLHLGHDDEEDPLRFMLDLTRNYGDLVRYQTTYGTTYLANHPDFISTILRSSDYPRGSLLKMVLGEGLLSADGEHWQKQRKLMLPDFHPRVVAKYTDVVYDCTLEFVQRCVELSARGEIVDAADETFALTIEIVTRALFSGELSSQSHSLSDTVTTLLADVSGFITSEFTMNFDISPARNRSFRKAMRQLDEMIYEVLTRRREDIKNGILRHDLIDLLLGTRDEDGVGLSDKEVRDEVVTMLFAGNETTAVTLAWAMHSIIHYPGVEAELRSELNTVLDGRAPTLEDMANLPYLKMALLETMRIYPPVWSIFRKVRKDDEMGGYRIEAGNTIIVSPYTMHHHPDFWPEPGRFDAQRFTFQNEKARPKYAYIPFGGGRHACIGKHLAMMELQIVIAVFTQCFQWKLKPGHTVEHERLVTLRPKGGLPVTLEVRPEAARVIADLMSKKTLAS